MRIIWWIFLPSVYLLFCILVMQFLKWATASDEQDCGECSEVFGNSDDVH